MSERFFVDKEGSADRYATFDRDGNLVSVEVVDDAEPVLEWCKGRFNADTANRFKSDFWHAGSYPVGVLEVFGRKLGIQPTLSESVGAIVARMLGKDKDMTRMLLNDRDLSGFRTMPGRF